MRKREPLPQKRWSPCNHAAGERPQWRGGKVWIQNKREPSEFRQFFQLKIEKFDLCTKMTAFVKLLLLVMNFFLLLDSEFRKSNSDKSRRVIFLSQNNHVPQNQTFGLKNILSDKVSNFRQTVRQVLIWIQTINCLAGPLPQCSQRGGKWLQNDFDSKP